MRQDAARSRQASRGDLVAESHWSRQLDQGNVIAEKHTNASKTLLV